MIISFTKTNSYNRRCIEKFTRFKDSLNYYFPK